MLPVPKIRIPRKRIGKLDLPAPFRPRLDSGEEPELLGGQVQGMKASAGEERFAKALAKINAVDSFKFRYTNIPRGLPGFFEIDFVVSSGGMVYAIEIDTQFTHRSKGRKDVLHDAMSIKDLEQRGYLVYPTVIHLDGESDLITQRNADRSAMRLLG